MKTYNLIRKFGNRATLTQVDKNLYKLDGPCEFVRVVRNESGDISSFEPEGCFPIKLGDIVRRDTEFRLGEQIHYILHTIDKLLETKNDYLVEINLKKSSLEYVNHIIQNSTSADRELNAYGSSVNDDEDSTPRVLFSRRPAEINQSIWGDSNMWVSGQYTTITGACYPTHTINEEIPLSSDNPCGEAIVSESVQVASPSPSGISNFRVEFGTEGSPRIVRREDNDRRPNNFIACSG